MAVVSHQHEFIYLLNPRTASTATAKALLSSVPCCFVPAQDMLDDDGGILVPRKHTTMSQLRDHKLLEEGQLNRYFKFVTVRNPFDSVVSAWAKKVKDYAGLLNDPDSWVHKVQGYADGLRKAADTTFQEWVSDQFGQKLREGRGGSMNLKFIRNVDFVLRYESLHSDFEKIRNRLGLDTDFHIPVVNVTKGREDNDFRAYYDHRTKKIISTVFREELELLGYRF